ncbi:MAG: hypothetical protein DWB56_03895 [Candidatus Jettenia sp.]|uniref:Uncharacterized protein n=1 Tax=Candidatus Jettenia caeni TaxID=247490 RepID=I3ILU7_9BACT|nr:hypothetical protein [Candidatus Jettenia sp.]MCE7879196.1 hypothetical protein [Candidatus Jettenia sp. AMX1]NUN24913.1 hypothetical protein [Candidatus Jettenia caeni]GAB62692.1 hypothetical protein KSU1_C1096 [Candidatus Jettenia caeni]GJQ46422.1 MAG: hypothetical protein JETCAE04_21760 [Candidatus Jettenia caeni]
MYKFLNEDEKQFTVECLQDLYYRLKKIVGEDFWEDVVRDNSPSDLADPVKIDALLEGKEDNPTEYFSLLTELMDIAIEYIGSYAAYISDLEGTIKSMEAERN